MSNDNLTEPTTADVTVLEKTSLSTDDVNILANEIENFLISVKANQQAAVAAMLAISALNIRPELAGANLVKVIHDVSQFICMVDVEEVVDAEKVVGDA